jgi:tRNA 2-thiouridine synthesizing protein A
MEKVTLDTQGLLCPLPVLKAKKALRSLRRGDQLEVLTTDPGAVADFKCLCEEDGLVLLSQTEDGETVSHLLEKM